MDIKTVLGIFGGMFSIGAVTFPLTFLIKRYAARLGIMAVPYAQTGTRISLWGGVPFMAVAAILAPLFFPLTFGQSLVLFLGIVSIILFGMLDDIVGLSPAPQFLAQVTIAAVFISATVPHPFLGDITGTSTLALVGALAGSWNASLLPLVWGIFLLLIFFVAFMNAFNWIDGLDGLAASVSIIPLFSVGGFFIAQGLTSAGFLSLFFGAAILGFLLLNFPPARVYMGTAGSMGLGLFLAFTAAYEGAFLFFIAACALPLGDAILVTFQRICAGQSPFQGGDRRHLHYRLSDLGWGSKKIMLLYVLIFVVFSL